MTVLLLTGFLAKGTANPSGFDTFETCEDICRDTLAGNPEPVITICIAGCEGGAGSGMHEEFCEDMCDAEYPSDENLRNLCKAGCTGVLGDDPPFNFGPGSGMMMGSGMGSGMDCEGFCETTFTGDQLDLCMTGCSVTTPDGSGIGVNCEDSCDLAFPTDDYYRNLCITGCSGVEYTCEDYCTAQYTEPTLRETCTSGCAEGPGSGMASGYMDSGMGSGDDFMDSGMGSSGSGYMDSGMGSGDDYMDSGMGSGDDYMDSGMGSGDDYMDSGMGSGDDYMDSGMGPDDTNEPTNNPTSEPTSPVPTTTSSPTSDPTAEPTNDPTSEPTVEETPEPTREPTLDPTSEPTYEATPSPTRPPTFKPKEGFRKIRKLQIKFREALTVRQCEDMTPFVCLSMNLPVNRCRFVRPTSVGGQGRRRLQVTDDTLVTDPEYEADLLSEEEVQAVENQSEDEFLEDFNESVAERLSELGLSEAPEALNADGRVTDAPGEASSNGAAIAGGIIGGLAAAILAAGLCYKYKTTKTSKAAEVELAENDFVTTSPMHKHTRTGSRSRSKSHKEEENSRKSSSWVNEDESEGEGHTTAGAVGENAV